MNFLTIITRIKDEPYINEFVDYYLSQGIDFIHILDDHSSLPLPIEVLKHPKVCLHQSQQFKAGQILDTNALYKQIRHESEWFMFVDADEFITTRKNITSTIKEELQTTFREAHCVKVPWVMMSSNHRERDPESLLGELVHRWNHDLRHPHPTGWHKGRCRYERIEIKTLFRGASFGEIASAHLPGQAKPGALVVESVFNKPTDLNPFFSGLHEYEISVAHLLCYHYRIISRESCLRKINTSSLEAYKIDIENLLACDYGELTDFTLQSKFALIN